MVYENLAAAVETKTCFKGDHGKTFALNSNSTDSRLFRRFMLGLEKQMGRHVKQDLGISVEVLCEVLNHYERDLCTVSLPGNRRRELIVSGAALVILYTAGLQGGEIFMLEASETSKRIREGKEHAQHPHVLAALMGRFKSKTGERNMLFTLANVTASGIQVRKWIERLVELLVSEGKHRFIGPAICDRDGVVLERWKLNNELF